MKIGLYPGSFNPIHVGHVALANYILEHTDLEEVWFVVSPQNPLKEQNTLLNDDIRLKMTKSAIEDFTGLKASDVEFSLPKPSYTIQTLKYLTEKYPDDDFTLIIGADNIEIFDKWKDYREILSNYKIMIYPRKGHEYKQIKNAYSIEYIDAPLFDISSTEIREKIKHGEDVSCFLPEKVLRFIEENNLYR